jgi:hypothetical protein
MLSDLNKDRYWGFTGTLNMTVEPELQKKNGRPCKCESLYACPEQLSHFKMSQKAEIFQTYRGTNRPKEKNSKSGKFCPGGQNWGMKNEN